MSLSAVLDACVLYSAPLRDFFMRLAVELYQPKWTNAIHEEWIRNVLNDRPDLTHAQLNRTRELMDKHGGTCMVSGYEALIPQLTLPDPDDRHVLAAAIHSESEFIVTFNTSDFPATALSVYGIRAVMPDAFTVALYDESPVEFVTLARRHRAALVNPAKDVDDYLATLAKCGLTVTVGRLDRHQNEI